MIKLLATGIWVAMVLAGSVILFDDTKSDAGSAKPELADYFGGFDYVKLEPISISIVRDNQVRGYLVLDVVFTVDGSEKFKPSVPLEYLLNDAILMSVYENNDLDIFRLEKFDLKKFQNKLLKDINDKLGESVVNEILIQKIEFISKDDVRDLQIRRS